MGLYPEEIPQTEEELNKTILKIKELAIQNRKTNNEKANINRVHNETNNCKKVVVIGAIDDMIAIIRKYKLEKNGVLYCCPFNRELVKHALENRLYIGFGGTSTFKSSKNAKEIVNMVPNDRILIETDSPYLSREPKRGTRNDSSNLKYVVEKLAEYKGMSIEEVAKNTYENAYRLFNL